MNYILEGLFEAFKLIFSFDREVYEIIVLSLVVSFSSTAISAAIGIPLSVVMSLREFPLKKKLVKLTYMFMSIPPVVVGLIVLLFLSRKGPLGHLQMLYTAMAMIIAQVILITPIIVGVIYGNTKDKAFDIKNLCRTLGGNHGDEVKLMMTENKKNILIGVITGFSRGISEVGAVMVVGGNILGHTRVMTTYIAMNNSMGNYAQSIAMGIVLLILAFLTNNLLNKLGEGGVS